MTNRDGCILCLLKIHTNTFEEKYNMSKLSVAWLWQTVACISHWRARSKAAQVIVPCNRQIKLYYTIYSIYSQYIYYIAEVIVPCDWQILTTLLYKTHIEGWLAFVLVTVKAILLHTFSLSNGSYRSIELGAVFTKEPKSLAQFANWSFMGWSDSFRKSSAEAKKYF